MKLIEPVKAYPAVCYLCTLRLPYPKMREILRLRDRIKPEAEFYSTEERKLLERYARHDENGQIILEGDVFYLKGPTEAEQYAKEIRTLQELEIELGVTPITITDAEMGTQPVSGEDIERLKGFITIGG